MLAAWSISITTMGKIQAELEIVLYRLTNVMNFYLYHPQLGASTGYATSERGADSTSSSAQRYAQRQVARLWQRERIETIHGIENCATHASKEATATLTPACSESADGGAASLFELDRKRPMKRVHNNSSNSGGSSPTDDGQSRGTAPGAGLLIENCSPIHTASLGRHKLIWIISLFSYNIFMELV